MLKQGMIEVDWGLVNGNARGMCMVGNCYRYAKYMKQTNGRYKPYYKTYCKYCATDEKRLREEGYLVEGYFREGLYVDCKEIGLGTFDCCTKFIPKTDAKVLGYISESRVFYIKKECV